MELPGFCSVPGQGSGEGDDVFNVPSPEQQLGAAARQEMESLSPGDQIQTLLSLAGTKVYNLCHGVTEAPGERQLSPFPEPSTKSMAAKAKTPTIFSPGWHGQRWRPCARISA